LGANVKTHGSPWNRVEFYSDDSLIGAATEAPHELAWTNAFSGTHELTARLLDGQGTVVVSEPVAIWIPPPDAQALLRPPDKLTQGAWPEIYGKEGFVIPGFQALDQFVWFSALPGPFQTWPEYTTDPRALLEPSSETKRVPSAWTSESEISFEIHLRDGAMHRLGFYFVSWDDPALKQIIEIQDAETGAVLVNEVLQEFAEGIYRIWSVRGHLRVILKPLNGGRVILSGVFIDPSRNQIPDVSLQVSPSSSFVAPGTIVFEPNAIDSDGQVVRVEFFSGEDFIGQSTNAPFRFEWTNVWAGNYRLQARAFDDRESSRLSEPVQVDVALPPGKAALARVDAATQGDWLGKYGNEGHLTVLDSTELPPYFRLETEGREHAWHFNSLEPRALRYFSNPGGLAACLVSNTNLTFNATFLDGKSHLLSFYLLDWDSGARTMRVTVWDPVGNQLLDSLEISDFFQGKYLSWRVQGKVQISFEPIQGNAVVSGIFLDPDHNAPPQVRIASPANNAIMDLPEPVIISTEAFDSDPGIRQVRFYAGTNYLGQSDHAPFQFAWIGGLEGTYDLTARAVDLDGASTISEVVRVGLKLPPAAGEFVAVDADTQGNWHSVYGETAYTIFALATNDTPAIQLRATDERLFSWLNVTSDPRALLYPVGQTRIAAGITAEEQFQIYLRLLDGRDYLASFYLLDWEDSGRSLTISVHDSNSQAVLAQHFEKSFGGGKYVRFKLRGDLFVQFKAETGNAVLSGIFIDPYFKPFEQWKMSNFSSLELTNPGLSGDSSDPDGDGVKNLLEYALGLDPRKKDGLLPKAEVREGRLTLSFARSKSANDVSLIVEASPDLMEWSATPDWIEISEEPAGNDFVTLTARFKFPVDVAPKGFLRLRVLRN
ncbi:MAG: Ig-like domain-containing protein, partial [Verrucomicrobiota bacterium]